MRQQRFLAAVLATSLLLGAAVPSVVFADNAYGTNPYGYVSGGSAAPVTPVYSSGYAGNNVANPVYPATYGDSKATGSTSYSYGTSTTTAAASPSYSYSYPTAPITAAPATTMSPYASSAYGETTLQGRISTIPRGTIMLTRLDGPVSTYTARAGDPISATVETDIFNGPELIVPAGSTILGSVTGAEASGRVGKGGQLQLQFNVIRRPDGSTVPFQGHMVTEDNTGVIKGNSAQSRVINTVVPAVGGAAAGTVLGTAAGSLLSASGAGAGFGLAVGSIAGVSYALLRRGKEVNIPSGARLSIMVDQASGI